MGLRSSICIFSLFILLGQSVRAETSAFSASYSITWRGFEIAQVATNTRIEDDQYQISFDSKTVGLVGTIFPFTSNGTTIGRLTPSGPIPENHSGIRSFRDNTRSWSLDFGEKGEVLKREVDAADLEDRDPVPEELWQAPDPMSLTLKAVLEVGPGVSLSGRSFDGRRVVDASMDCDPNVELDADAQSELLRCQLSGRLVAGASERWRERNEGREENREFTIWLAKGLLDESWWPTLMEADTPFGPVAVTLIEKS